MSVVVADYVVPGNSGVIKVRKLQCNTPSADGDVCNKAYLVANAGDVADARSTTLNWTGADGAASCAATLATIGRLNMLHFNGFSFAGNDAPLQADWGIYVRPMYATYGVSFVSDGVTTSPLHCVLFTDGTMALSLNGAAFTTGKTWTVSGFAVPFVALTAPERHYL